MPAGSTGWACRLAGTVSPSVRMPANVPATVLSLPSISIPVMKRTRERPRMVTSSVLTVRPRRMVVPPSRTTSMTAFVASGSLFGTAPGCV